MSNERFAEFTEEAPKAWVQGLYEESSVQKQRLGVRRKLSDGREFVYVKVGAANIAAGKIVGAAEWDPSPPANIANLTVTANANVGEREISFTLGNSNLANEANAFKDGFIWVNTGSGNGSAYKIRYHAAIAANANGTVYLYDKIRANITTSSKVSLWGIPAKKVIIANTTLVSSLVGATTYEMTANYYGWLQAKGPAAVEVEGTCAPGNEVYLSAANGTVCIGANGTSEPKIPIGQVIANAANDHWALIDLNL